MKPTDILNSIAKLGHTVSGLTTIATSVTGGERPTGGGFFERIARMVPAVLTKDDEIRFELLLQKLDALAQDPNSELFHTRPRQIIIWFMQWHFKKRCVGEHAVSFWYQNAFQKFVVDLDATGGDNADAGLNFLVWMVKTILVDGDGDLAEGFTKLADQLEHVPHVPEGARAYIDQAQLLMNNGAEATQQGYRDAKAGLIQHRRGIEREVALNKSKPKSWLDKLIK